VSLLKIRVPCAVDTPAFLPVVFVVPIPILVALKNVLPTLIPPENVETPEALPAMVPLTFRFPETTAFPVALKLLTVVTPERTTPVSLNVTVLNPLRFCI
jgi:hypothetical protein